MNIRNLSIVNAILAVTSAIALLLFPVQYGDLFNVTSDPTALLFARMLGSQLLAIAAICWFGRNLGTEGRRILAIGLTMSWTVFTIVTLLGVTSGVMSSAGYLWVAIGALMSLGWIGAATGIGVRAEARSA